MMPTYGHRYLARPRPEEAAMLFYIKNPHLGLARSSSARTCDDHAKVSCHGKNSEKNALPGH